MADMPDIPEEPPDENEQYENLDEALDAEDVSGEGGPEGERELDSELVVDRVALHEVGADLDDPDRISLIDGMDDPDGSGPWPEDDPDAGYDVDPVTRDRDAGRGPEYGDEPSEWGESSESLGDSGSAGAAGPANAGSADADAGDGDEPADPAFEEIDTDATDMDQIPSDQPGPDSARW